MVMLTLHLVKDENGNSQIPFNTVYVHGLVRDSQGQKMSKSKGNVLDPLDIVDGIDLETLVQKRTTGLMNPKDAAKIEKATRKEFAEGIAAYGTDALRYTFYSLATTGRDINFDMGRVEGYRNFCNKLWNASNYVLSNCENQDCGADGNTDYQLTLADRWIISRLQETEKAVEEGFATYRLDLVSQVLYDFIWKDYCDWYIELSKPVLWDENASAAVQRGTRRTLVRVLEATLRLAHPLMPFITEEIWQRVKPLAGVEGKTLMLQPYPKADASKLDAGAIKDIEWLKGVIVAVRNIRGEMNIGPAKKLPLYLADGNDEDKRILDANRQFLAKLAGLESITWLNAGEAAPMSATALVGKMQVMVPMAGLIDKSAELARLAKEQDKLQKEIERVQTKLDNPAFADKAPADVVQKERDKVAEAREKLSKLEEQAGKIAAL